MSDCIHIVVPMVCPGSIRATPTIMPNKAWRGRRDVAQAWIARMLTSTKQRAWRSRFIGFALSGRPRAPLEGPLRLDLLLVLPRPKRLCRRKDPDGLLWAPTYPDRDNAEKIICDAMTRAGFWGDDRQVVSGQIVKVYAEKSGSPRVEIWLCRAAGAGPNVADLGGSQGSLDL